MDQKQVTFNLPKPTFDELESMMAEMKLMGVEKRVTKTGIITAGVLKELELYNKDKKKYCAQ